jgi:hypothetical protein
MIQDATHTIDDALLTLIFRLGLWPCHLLFCIQSLPICWLWVNAIAQPLNHTRCNTQDCWCSVDALLMLCWRSVDALLTLCWRSLSGEATSTLTILQIKEAITSIMDTCHSAALGWYKMQHTKSLTLCWRSFSDWGCDHVAFSFDHKVCQYVDY